MIDRITAQRIAEEAVNEGYDEPGDRLEIVEDSTLEREFGWVFFCDSRNYLRTGDDVYLLAGNSPIIVNRADGSVERLGTGRPAEDYILEYEQRIARKPSGE